VLEHTSHASPIVKGLLPTRNEDARLSDVAASPRHAFCFGGRFTRKCDTHPEGLDDAWWHDQEGQAGQDGGTG